MEDSITTLNIRGIDTSAVTMIKRAAAARGMTAGEYVGRLARLHEAARAHADAGNDGIQAELMALGLETVRA